jgi:hypothetical protein
MLRGELQNEIEMPGSWAFPNRRNYQYIEQVFKVPLWYIETLASENSKDSEGLWNRYIASSPSAALEALRAHKSTNVIVHVLLPGYLVQQADPVLTRCRTLWECCVTGNQAHRVILVVTDHGEFVDFQDAVELNELEKIELVWQGS